MSACVPNNFYPYVYLLKKRFLCGKMSTYPLVSFPRPGSWVCWSKSGRRALVSETGEAATIVCQSSCHNRLYHSSDSDAEDEKHLRCTFTDNKRTNEFWSVTHSFQLHFKQSCLYWFLIMQTIQEKQNLHCNCNITRLKTTCIQLLPTQGQEWIRKCKSSCCGLEGPQDNPCDNDGLRDHRKFLQSNLNFGINKQKAWWKQFSALKKDIAVLTEMRWLDQSCH